MMQNFMLETNSGTD